MEDRLRSEIAYYYPEPYCLAREGGWIKSLLLFFDEVAVLLPSYMHGRHLLADLTLAGPLEDQGLLRILEPKAFVDDATATQLTEVIGALVDGGAFDELSQVERLAELSMSRMGYGTMRAVAGKVGGMLRERGPCNRFGGWRVDSDASRRPKRISPGARAARPRDGCTARP